MTSTPSYLPLKLALTALCVGTIILLPTYTRAATTLTEAIHGGKATVDIRYRYETVEQDNALEDASATTVRTRLGYLTDSFDGLSAFVEFENTSIAGSDDYNSTLNGKTQYSVIADPEISEVNQAFVGYSVPEGVAVKYGRQRITLDNHRFIGNVGWRQNEQTFDAFSLVDKSFANTVLTYAYLYNVNRINGANADMSSNILNASYSGLTAGTLTGYAYLLDYENTASLSTSTFGLRLKGEHAYAGDNSFLYTLEYAQQSDGGDNPANFDLNYMLFEAGAKANGVTAKVGYEVLEGDGTNSVQTPLATLHAMNGWTDQFLTTPADGLEDTYLSIGTAYNGVKLLIVYHDFSGNELGTDFGDEWGLLAKKNFGKTYSLLGKYASYTAGDPAAGKVDTDKLWIAGELKF